MKILAKSILATGLMFASLSASALLKDDMKQIGGIFKALGQQFKDPSMNNDSAQLAGQLAALFGQAINEVPPSIENLPQAEKDVAIAHFKTLIQQEIDLSLELQKAFLANDNAAAFEILKKISALRGEGHDIFNPHQ